MYRSVPFVGLRRRARRGFFAAGAVAVVGVVALGSFPVQSWTTTSPQVTVLSIGGTSSDLAMDMAVDGSGNVYVTGQFQGTMDFDPSSTGTANLTAVLYGDAFVAKYDSSGNYLWAKRFGDTSSDFGKAVDVDSSGNVYVAGTFGGVVDFDPDPSTTTNLTSAGSDDVFVVKFASDGTLVWARGVGGSGYDIAEGLAVDSTGNAYIAGYFTGTADFDPDPAVTESRAANAGMVTEDGFLFSLDSAGAYRWVNQVGGGPNTFSNESVMAVDVDSNGNVVASGIFSREVDFDPGSGTASMTPLGWRDTFVWKMTSAGARIWAKQFGGAATNNYNQSLDVAPAGEVYGVGQFTGTADFDPGTGVANLTSSGQQDAYAVKLDSSGAYQWAGKFGGTSNEYGYGIAADATGNIYLGGDFAGTADMDPGSSAVNLESAGGTDAYAVKLNSSGVFQWAKRVGGIDSDQGKAVNVDASGNVLVNGTYGRTVDFDTGECTASLTSVFNSSDVFVLRMDPSGVSSSSAIPAVTYAANDGTGSEPNTTGCAGTSVTLSAGTGLTRTGYTLSRWDTAAAGNGTPYNKLAPVTMPSGGLSLHAIWTANTYSVTYAANGGTGSVPASSSATYGTSFAVAANTGPLVNPGLTFSGWNTEPNGTGTNFTAGVSTTWNIASATTLHARWIDTSAPAVTLTSGTIRNVGSVSVESTEPGTVYLVSSGVSVTNVASITGAADSAWNQVMVGAANTSVSLSAAGLSDGSYVAYAVDAAGNLSVVSLATVTIDSTPPVVTLEAGSPTSTSTSINYTVTGDEAIDCASLSDATGVDFDLSGISAISGIVQTSDTLCTISATSTATAGGSAVTSTLSAATTFSIDDELGNSQTTLTGGSQSIAVSIAALPSPSSSAPGASSPAAAAGGTEATAVARFPTVSATTAPAALAPLAPTMSAPKTVAAGRKVSIVAAGFQPGESVILRIGKTGQVRTVTAGADGRVRVSVTLEAEQAGTHQVVASSSTSGRRVTQTIRVTADASDLPVTGQSVAPWLTVALMLFLIGHLIIWRRRSMLPG